MIERKSQGKLGRVFLSHVRCNSNEHLCINCSFVVSHFACICHLMALFSHFVFKACLAGRCSQTLCGIGPCSSPHFISLNDRRTQTLELLCALRGSVAQQMEMSKKLQDRLQTLQSAQESTRQSLDLVLRSVAPQSLPADSPASFDGEEADEPARKRARSDPLASDEALQERAVDQDAFHARSEEMLEALEKALQVTKQSREG